MRSSRPAGRSSISIPSPAEFWLERAILTWPRSVWINPTPENHLAYSRSTRMIADIFQRRMFPRTPDGVEAAMRALAG